MPMDQRKVGYHESLCLTLVPIGQRPCRALSEASEEHARVQSLCYRRAKAGRSLRAAAGFFPSCSSMMNLTIRKSEGPSLAGQSELTTPLAPMLMKAAGNPTNSFAIVAVWIRPVSHAERIIRLGAFCGLASFYIPHLQDARHQSTGYSSLPGRRCQIGHVQ